METKITPRDTGVLQDTYVLSSHEVDSLRDSLGAHQAILGASDIYQSGELGPSPIVAPGMRLNRGTLTIQAKQIKKVLDDCSPRPIAEKDRDRYYARAKWLEDQFRTYLETREEIHVKKRDNPAWQSSMDKFRIRNVERPELEAYIAEWKYIKRRLEPGNRDADNLHKLRVSKTP